MIRKIFYGVCAIAPGGLIALAAVAVVDKKTRTTVIKYANKTVDTIKKHL